MRPSSPPGAAADGTGRKGAADLTSPSRGSGRRRRDRDPDGCTNRAEGAGLRYGGGTPAPNPCPEWAERPAGDPGLRPSGRSGRAGTALTWTRAARGVSRTSRGGARRARRLLPPRLRLPPRPDSARLSRRHVPTLAPPSRPRLWLRARRASGRGRHRQRPAGKPRPPDRAGARSRPRARREPAARPSCRPPPAARTPRPPRPPRVARRPPVGPPALPPAPGRPEKGVLALTLAPVLWEESLDADGRP